MDDFQANIADFAAQLNDTADSLATYRALTDTAQSLLESSSALVGQTATAIDGRRRTVGQRPSGGPRHGRRALGGRGHGDGRAVRQRRRGSPACATTSTRCSTDAQSNATATADGAASAVPPRVADQAALYRQLHDTLLGLPGAADNPRPDGRGGRAAAAPPTSWTRWPRR